MEMVDYYGVLGIGVGASGKEIKGAYRRMAKRTHPDLAAAGRQKVAEEQFKVVAEAYYVLSDKYRRYEYDLSRKGGGEGSRYKVQGSGKGQGRGSKVEGRAIDINPDDLWEEILRVANQEFHKTDRSTYAVRFGCGGFLGIFVGMWVGLYVFPYKDHAFLFFLLSGIGIFGFLAAVYGDKFWKILLGIFGISWRGKW